jgi:hypothetical protein
MESLKDFRDVSYRDFIRQLENEQVIAPGQEVVWGKWDQLVTSDMTFAGAIQEQLYEARHMPDTLLNEATFMIKGESNVQTGPPRLQL